MLTPEQKEKTYKLAEQLSKLSEESLIIAESNIKVLEARDAMEKKSRKTA